MTMRTAALLGALLLTGCASVTPPVAQDYRPIRERATAAQPFMEARHEGIAASEPPDHWWRLFNDEQLDSLVTAALSQNAELRVATANLARSQAITQEAGAALDPRLALAATAVRAQESAEAYLLPDKLPVENLADGGVRLSYRIDFAGAARREIEAAQADTEVSRALLRGARIQIAAAVVMAYLDGCSASRQLALSEQALALQQQYESATSRLVAGGRLAALDLPRASGNTAQSLASLPAFRARQRLAAFQIATLTGHPPAELPDAVASCHQLPSVTRPVPVGDGASLLRRRPDVQQAEHALGAATARVGVATAALYPTVTLGLSAGATGILDHIGQAQTQRWNLGPLISWTVPGGAERARVAQADANASAAMARFDVTVLKALQDVESALALLARDLDRAAALQAARAAAAEAARQTAALEQAGRLPALEGIAAQQRLATADLAIAAAAEQVASDQVRLFLALGGGWSSDAPGAAGTAGAAGAP